MHSFSIPRSQSPEAFYNYTHEASPNYSPKQYFVYTLLFTIKLYSSGFLYLKGGKHREKHTH
jgi:hypothetical protein